MRTGQPFPHDTFSLNARRVLLALVSVCVALASSTCGGGTAVTSVVGPDTPRCQTTAVAQPSNVPADGGTVAVNVSAARDCTWTATTDTPWLQLSATSGQGTGSVSVTVARNELPSARSGGVSVNDVRVTLAQEARPCTFELRSSSTQLGSEGGLGSIALTTVGGCAWTASSSASWLRVLTTSGTGNGTIRFEAEPNAGTARDAVITVGNASITVVQDGAGPGATPGGPNCVASVNPTSLDLPLGGGPATVALTINPTCDWTAATTSSWLTINPPTTGRGPATIGISAPRNTGAERTATLLIALQPVTVRQPGSCEVTINPSSASYSQSGGSGAITVQTAAGCTWSASSNQTWATIAESNGNGNGEVRYSISANTTSSTRTATISVGSRQHTVTQRGCAFTLAPTSASIPASGGRGSFRVSTDGSCPWTVSGATSGVTTSPSSGSGNGEVSYTVPANTTTSARTITLRVGGQTHVITQEAAAPTCTVSVEPVNGPQLAATAAASQFNVVTGPTCQWSVSGGGDFATVTSGRNGTGPGTVAYSVAAHTGTSARSTTLVVTSGSATASHTVNQDGAAPPPACTVSVQPSAGPQFAASGGSSQFNVVTGPSCQWSVSGGGGFASATSGTNGTGPGTVTYSVAANTATSGRNTTLVVTSGSASASHAISQDGAAPPPPTCTVSVQPSAGPQFAASGGSSQFNVVTGPSCQWSVSGGGGFASATSGTSGTGPGTVTYSVAANTATAGRNTTLVVTSGSASASHAISQDGAAPPPPTCTVSVEPSAAPQFPASGGSSQFNVVTGPSCQWSVSGGGGFASATSGTSGTGPGTVTYSVAANTATSGRNTTLVVTSGSASASHAISQDAAPPPAPTCTMSVEPASSPPFAASGGPGSFNVITQATCQWSASAGGFATISAGSGGTGPGAVSYTVAANTTTAPRTATVVVTSGSASATHTVNQQAAAPPPPPPPTCTVAVEPQSSQVAASGGPGSFNVVTQASCQWTASASGFASITTGSGGTGPGQVSFTAAANTTTEARNATITVTSGSAAATHTVNQQAAAPPPPPVSSCTFSIEPTGRSAEPQGALGIVQVSTGPSCEWRAEARDSWIRLSRSRDTGAGAVGYAIEPNDSGSERVGTAIIAGQTFTVRQGGRTR